MLTNSAWMFGFLSAFVIRFGIRDREPKYITLGSALLTVTILTSLDIYHFGV